MVPHRDDFSAGMPNLARESLTIIRAAVVVRDLEARQAPGDDTLRRFKAL